MIIYIDKCVHWKCYRLADRKRAKLASTRQRRCRKTSPRCVRLCGVARELPAHMQHTKGTNSTKVQFMEAMAWAVLVAPGLLFDVWF